MTKKNSKSLLDAVETLVGQETVFEGNIKTEKALRIDGKFNGNIEALGVLIGADARIKGNVIAKVIMVGGTVVGNLTAEEYIEILSSAKVTGDIATNLLTIAEGALFEGNSSMLKNESENGAAKK